MTRQYFLVPPPVNPESINSLEPAKKRNSRTKSAGWIFGSETQGRWQAMSAVLGKVHGVLGGRTAGTASWHRKARDLHIGWSQAAWDANFGRVVNNDRFLPLPGVRLHGRASLVLSLFHGRVADDWEERYGVRPDLDYS